MNPLQPYQYKGKDRFADFPPLPEGWYAMNRAPSPGWADQLHVSWHNGSSREWLDFESLPAAIAFAEAEVTAHPISSCELYDFDRKKVHRIWVDVIKNKREIILDWDKVLREDVPVTACSECLQAIEAKLAHDAYMERERMNWLAALAKRLGLSLGKPTDPVEKKSFDQALQCLRDAWSASGAKGEITFEDGHILSSPRWWHIPFTWIGCSGFIVDRNTGHVNMLGSCNGLDLCLWAQDHGIVAGDTDFVIHEIRDMEHAQLVVRGFVHPSSTAEQARNYTKVEAAQSLQSLPAEFLSHELWFSFDAIREAAEAGAFTFTARPALHPRNRLGPSL